MVTDSMTKSPDTDYEDTMVCTAGKYKGENITILGYLGCHTPRLFEAKVHNNVAIVAFYETEFEEI